MNFDVEFAGLVNQELGSPADLLNQSLVYLGGFAAGDPILDRFLDFMLCVCWAPSAKILLFVELVSRTLFVPMFEQKSGRLGFKRQLS